MSNRKDKYFILMSQCESAESTLQKPQKTTSISSVFQFFQVQHIDPNCDEKQARVQDQSFNKSTNFHRDKQIYA